ncbi:MAG: TlpA family protein disulfide reductase [Acidimicrobiia bacterium]|nr:TlpA family protein disulfide reductase [Acidimicrobiia bacterium]
MSNRPAANRPDRGGAPEPPRKGPSVIGLAIAAVVVVVGIGLAITLLAGGDDEGAATTDGTGTTTAAAEQLVFGEVAVEGTSLPEFAGPENDPAVGQAAPVLEGSTPAGTPITVGDPGEPTIIAFLAHWCPHCQRELPLLVQLAGEGAFDGVRLQAVLTGTNTDAPNFPPAAWLEREGWTGDVLLDDEGFTAAQSYALSSYPLLVALDADGNVVARSVGELPAEELRAMADSARGEG